MKDVTLEPTENAHLATRFPPSAVRAYQSGLFPEMVSLAFINNDAVTGGTRLDIGQVIALHEALEEFIEDHYGVRRYEDCDTTEVC